MDKQGKVNKQDWKLNFARIDFDNCGLEYDYTICKWDEIPDWINKVETVFADSQPKEYKAYGEPTITITPAFMTQNEFNQWQESLPDNEL